MPEIWAEIWTRPGHPTFGRVIDEAPSSNMSWHDGVNLVGDGSLAIAESFGRFDEILKVDQTTPANSVKSLVRLFSEGSATPFFEWLPKSILPTTDKLDLNVDVAGKGIKSILGDARVEAYDWDESVSFVPEFADWIYGLDSAANLLSNTEFSASIQNEKQQFHLHATAGLYTITIDGDTTVNLTAPEGGGTSPAIKAALEALPGIDTVSVTGAGNTQFHPLVIEFQAPGGVDYGQLTINDISLVYGACNFPPCHTPVISTISDGSFDADPWTECRDPRSGAQNVALHGSYDAFSVEDDPAGSGVKVLNVDPASSNAGGQQVISATNGAPFVAGAEVYSASATDEFRIEIRDSKENLIAASTPVTIPANTWTELTVSGEFTPPRRAALVGGPTPVVAYRVQVSAGGATPAEFFIKNPTFQVGLAATTIGVILGALYDDATSDHSSVRLVWEDEANPGTPYLTIDFTDALDSGGVPWFHDDISIRIWMRMTYLQVMTQIVNTWGYEWRIVPNDVEAGTWIWQVYNPGTMKTDYTAAASPAIQGGAEDVRRSIARVLPSATDHLVEGPGRITARYRDTDLTSALGMIEGSRLDRKLPGLVAIFDAAFEDSLAALTGGVVYVYDLIDPAELPLVAYLLGDLLTIHDPPEVEDEARLVDVIGTATAHEVIIGVQFTPATAAGS